MSVRADDTAAEQRPLSWLTGLMWADIGAVTGLALILSLNFPLSRHHAGREVLVVLVFVLAATTLAVAMVNRRLVQRVATREATVSAITELFALSMEIQRLMSELSMAQKADKLEQPLDLAAIEASLARVEQQARRLQQRRFSDQGLSELLWQSARQASENCSASLMSARIVPYRDAHRRPALWTDASGMARNALIVVGKALEKLQKSI
jgi:hypothetical protein